ncbi:MAG: threonine-phosphate decarboxylase CobD [Hyphomicrobiaceae bacterium]
MEEEVVMHGGDLAEASRRFGIAGDDWLDLSTGINPTAFAFEPLTMDCYRRLPSPARLAELEAAARAAYGVPPDAGLVAAPGTQALIQAIPRLFGSGNVGVVGPTYSEHEAAWLASNHAVIELAEPTGDDLDHMVIVNPNNPDGRTWSPDELASIGKRLGSRGGVMAVDEAFGDPYPELSAVRHAANRGLIVLRSFGKFFGLAGVRLGFAICEPRLAQRLRDQFGPWSVCGPAIEIGLAALSDPEWIKSAGRALHNKSHKLDAILRASGLGVIGGTWLFRLVETHRAWQLHDELARRGIWVRKFSYNERWLRFGLPADEAAFDRLGRALEEIRSGQSTAA